MQYAYKGVDKNMHTSVGGGVTYSLGKWFTVKEKDKLIQTHSYGFHCAKNPLDCYRSMGKVFLVQIDGDVDEEDNQLCATKIKFIKELDLQEYVAHAIKYMIKHYNMPNSSQVYTDDNVVVAGTEYVLVRSKNPSIKITSERKTLVCLLKEESNTRKIVEVNLFYIDGKNKKYNKTYDICGKELAD